MSDTVDCVPDLWREWSQGLGGNLSVRELEKRYGKRWRSSDAASKKYNRRRPVILEVERLKEAKKYSEIVAVQKLEEFRKARDLSLPALGAFLRQVAKAGFSGTDYSLA